MYQYDDFDRQFVQERVAHYREQTERYLAGKLSEDEFLQLRLRNGLYIQRLAPMLRVAIPYGTLSSTQLRALADISMTYDRGYGHLSTRQNMQFNWPEIADVPDILEQLAKVNMHAIQTSGSCIRNVTTDHFAGAAADEIVDPRPYCELIRQWSTSHPEFEWLPRKFKIAVSGAAVDRAAVEVHDIGLRVYEDEQQQHVFDVLVGGGLGRTPVVGATIRAALPAKHLLSYLQAILRVYNRYGRRDNKYKARIKILVRALGAESFTQQVETEWAMILNESEPLPATAIAHMQQFFTPPKLPVVNHGTSTLAEQRLHQPAFSRWVERNVFPHRTKGYSNVILSTKAVGVPPGDVSAEQMLAVASWAEQFGVGEIRITHEQNFVLPHIPQGDLLALWQHAQAADLATANAGLITDVICCPGGDFCSLANAKSIPIAEAIQRQLADADFVHDLGDVDLNISGCMNACGHHHVGHIGILGVDKKGQEFYQISLGGHAGHSNTQASLSQIIGPSVSRQQVQGVIGKIINIYLTLRQPDENFLSCFRRVGVDPFKASLKERPHDAVA
ncbi:MAG: nitrite/sulfite reductase [Pseudomonadota bacterium]|nr:nitrite/sulfite reductase [Pseudomonadota bacterium]